MIWRILHCFSVPRHARPVWHTMWRELPWVLATTVSCISLLSVVPYLNHPWGSNWPMYFESARYFWDPTAVYFGWRPPLYPLGLATLGQQIGFVKAGHLIAQVSMLTVIVCSGIMVRLIAGRGPAVLAVLSIPLLQCAVEGAMWTNMYPPAAAAVALAAAAGTMVWRRPNWVFALLAGLAAGLAWKINHLGLVAVPLGLGLTVLGSSRIPTIGRLIVLPILFGLGTATVSAVDTWVIQHWNVPQEELADQVIQRRREELDRLAIPPAGNNPFSACTDFTPKPLNLPELTNECGQQFVQANYGKLRSEDCVPSIPTLLWFLPLALLPGARKRDWRDTAAATLIFGGPIGAFLIAAAWTSYAEKYAISFLPMMVLLVPLAFDRAGAWLGRLIDNISIGRTMGFLGAVAWLITTWPGTATFRADTPNIQTDWESVAGRVADWSERNLATNDTLIDCVPLNIDLVLLPSIRTTLEGVSTEPDCMDWSIQPPKSEGRVWMVQQSFPDVVDTQPRHMQLHGWILIEQYDDRHHLWLYKP